MSVILAALAPLYGGGFTVAFLQIAALYYASAALLHFVVPRLLPVQPIQQEARNPGDVRRDALGSIGARVATLPPSIAPPARAADAPRARPRRPDSGEGSHLGAGGAAAPARLRPALHRAHQQRAGGEGLHALEPADRASSVGRRHLLRLDTRCA
jgi:hypothetical protein